MQLPSPVMCLIFLPFWERKSDKPVLGSVGLYGGLGVGRLSCSTSIVVRAISGISGDAFTNVGYALHIP